MQQFLASIERRAFSIAQMATQNRDDALDIVQEAMIKLVQKYSEKPPEDWKPLFYRILHTRILDWHRRQSVRNRFRSWLHLEDDENADNAANNVLEQVAGEANLAPDLRLQDVQFSEALNTALSALPLRQQQVFLLRVWEGMDIRDTSIAMQCSESSVKTHYQRALEKLRSALQEHH